MRRQRVEDRDQVAPLGRRQPGRRLVEQDEARRAGKASAISSWRCWPWLSVADQRVGDAVETDRVSGSRVACTMVASSRRGRSSEKRPRDTPRQARKIESRTLRPPNSSEI